MANAGERLAADVKDVPAKTLDSLTMGPQRRSLGKWEDQKIASAKSAWDNQWNEAKEILGTKNSSAQPKDKVGKAPARKKAAYKR
jgi:hypothetical protein